MATNEQEHIPAPHPEDEKSQGMSQEDPAPQGEEKKESKPPYQPYSRKARLWAWVGIAFMVFLVIMYTYAFSSGIILKY